MSRHFLFNGSSKKFLIADSLQSHSPPYHKIIKLNRREEETMARDTWMMERAKEELKSLEARHPSRFDYLKLELQSIISDYGLNPSLPNLISSPSSSSAGTQVSSNRKRRRGDLCDEELSFGLEKKRKMRLLSEDRAEMAIERAKACLRRIQLVKESFLQ